MLKTSCLLLEQRFASAFLTIVEGRRRMCQPSPRRVPTVGIGSGLPNGLLAAVAVGLIVVALTSIRLAEGSGCTSCAVSEQFTLEPTTIVVACLTTGC